MQEEIEKIRKRTKQFAIIVDCFASSINPPLMYDSNIKHYGFRYGKPTERHFCILKSVHAVSSINAAIELAEKGFNQEVCILMISVIDCLHQIEFVLSGYKDGKLSEKKDEWVSQYFSDYQRNDASNFKGKSPRQEDIHKEIDIYYRESGIIGPGTRFPDADRKKLMSNVYRTYSNYVHARYPEVMDMYGGTPGHFHMEGMSGTRKDAESINIIATFTDSIALSLVHMIGVFDMRARLQCIPELADWFKSRDEKH
jgi:hypothetical protein